MTTFLYVFSGVVTVLLIFAFGYGCCYYSFKENTTNGLIPFIDDAGEMAWKKVK